MKKLLVIAICILNLWLINATNSQVVAANTSSYSVLTLSEDGQASKLGYFELLVRSNQQKTIKLKIKNTSDVAGKFSIKLNPGVTGDSGKIIYNKDSMKIYSDVAFDVRKQIDIGSGVVNIPSYSEIIISIKVNMPNVSYDGVVLAGLEIERIDSEGEQKAASQSGVVSRVAYQIPILVRQNNNSVSGALEYRKASAKIKNGMPFFIFTLRNPNAAIIQDAVITTTIFKDQVEIMNRSLDDSEIAPTNNFSLKLYPADKKIEAGNYRVLISIKHHNKLAWSFDENFKVTEAKASTINQSSVYLKRNYDPWMIIAVVTGILSLILIVVILILIICGRGERTVKK